MKILLVRDHDGVPVAATVYNDDALAEASAHRIRRLVDEGVGTAHVDLLTPISYIALYAAVSGEYGPDA